MPKRELLHEWMHKFELALPYGAVRVWTKASHDWPPGEFIEQHTQIEG